MSPFANQLISYRVTQIISFQKVTLKNIVLWYWLVPNAKCILSSPSQGDRNKKFLKYSHLKSFELPYANNYLLNIHLQPPKSTFSMQIWRMLYTQVWQWNFNPHSETFIIAFWQNEQNMSKFRNCNYIF